MPKILIVDDEKNIRILLGRIIKKQNYPFDEASNVAEAKDLLKQNIYDLVFSDIAMPGESGVNLAEHVLKDHKDTSIVMITTINDPNMADEVLKLGVHGYITKPFDASQVLIQLSNSLYRKDLEKQNREYRESLERLVDKRTKKLNETVSNLERRATYASLIYNVSRRLSHKLNLNDLLEEIVNAIQVSFDYFGVMIFFYDETGEKYVLKNIAGGFRNVFPKDMAFDIGEGMIGITAQQAETQIASDVRKNIHFISRAGENTKSELCIPIINHNKVIGILDLQSIQLNAFDELDKEAMEILCMQLAIEIENAKLFENMQNEILERKQAEVALRDSEERLLERERFLATIIENIPLSLFIKEKKELTFITCNRAREELFGYSREDLIGKTNYDVFPKETADFLTQKDKEALESGKLIDIPEETVQTKKMGERILHTKKIPILDKNGKYKYLLGISEDITERKKMEKSIQENEQRIRTILESVQAGIIIVDAETRQIVDINKTALKLIGREKEEVVGKICHKFIYPAEKGKGSVCEFSGVVENSEEVLLTASGELIPIIKNIVNVKLDGRDQYIESFIDVSKLKDTEKALSQAQKLESIGQLAAGIAHEINTPMQYISDNTKFVQDAFEDINQFIEKYKFLKENGNGNNGNKTIFQDLDGVAQDVDLDFLLGEIPQSIKETMEGVNRVTKIVRSMKEFSGTMKI
jgi:PAS domain S-box-containing protein